MTRARDSLQSGAAFHFRGKERPSGPGRRHAVGRLAALGVGGPGMAAGTAPVVLHGRVGGQIDETRVQPLAIGTRGREHLVLVPPWVNRAKRVAYCRARHNAIEKRAAAGQADHPGKPASRLRRLAQDLQRAQPEARIRLSDPDRRAGTRRVRSFFGVSLPDSSRKPA